jgi:hypothetical protein
MNHTDLATLAVVVGTFSLPLLILIGDDIRNRRPTRATVAERSSFVSQARFQAHPMADPKRT